jgi:diguanylate cyclase (GGDEF)-like protein
MPTTGTARTTSPYRAAFTAAVACAGLGLAAAGVRATPPDQLAPALGFALAFGLLVQTLVTLPSGVRFSSAAVVLAAAATALGPAATWIVVPGYVVRFARQGDWGWRLWYTCGQIALSFAAAARLIPLLGGRYGAVHDVGDTVRALTFIVAYDVVNSAFAAGRLHLDQGVAWSRAFLRLLLHERGTAQPLYYALAVAAALLWSGHRWVGLTLTTVLGLFLHAALIQAGEVAQRHAEARTDTLTGVGNRRRLQDWVQAQPEGPWGLLFIDLDHLKAFNDRHGHAAGDAALVATAQVLREQTRAVDLLIRYGGDEFLAILPGANAAETEAVGRRIAAALRERTVLAGGEASVLHASVGAAAAPEHGTTLEDLLRHADSVMYGRKHRRGDGV